MGERRGEILGVRTSFHGRPVSSSGSGQIGAADVAMCLAGWVLANMIPFFWILKKLKLLRVSPEDEALGLDASYHGGTAYPGESTDVAFSWGGSPSGSQKDNSVRKATENTIEQAPSTSNVVLSKEAKAQQVTPRWKECLTCQLLFALLIQAMCPPQHLSQSDAMWTYCRQSCTTPPIITHLLESEHENVSPGSSR